MIKKMYGHSFSCNVSEWGQRPSLKKNKKQKKQHPNSTIKM